MSRKFLDGGSLGTALYRGSARGAEFRSSARQVTGSASPSEATDGKRRAGAIRAGAPGQTTPPITGGGDPGRGIGGGGLRRGAPGVGGGVEGLGEEQRMSSIGALLEASIAAVGGGVGEKRL